ncbi:imidazole glycerol phosphate synthase subunit HisH [Lipingzhangella sp. LS1_29]|uniref:Imidazole glycerol phosphate synthase subunit HisH n=1 Tax=Lipingzhangella rawalii TaxID=2055835 RepID=A0ABU2H2Z4_9ACTN|nr:imidazole glycerol phosphate synthase subunit HisH [Lipingzhangella rawalii]MDS1269357.1 imidazole glycerol phosphate synthase subunit HisH [Lipingzhangella rawalii]
MSPDVVILDYGSGNLRSAQRAVERAGARVHVTDDTAASVDAAGLIVPGVGAFAACAEGLRSVGGEQIVERRLAAGKPVLGICVGMQILFERGVEHGVTTAGCGRWPGTVERLQAPVVPHMGWNTVRAPEHSRMFAGIAPTERFYFVHSYALRSWEPTGQLREQREPAQVTWCTHGEPFVAAVEDGPLWATQFHPEKSADTGARLLTNWVSSL